MPEANDTKVFLSRTPLGDLLNTTSRLFPRTNVGWGEEGTVSLVEPGAVAARRRLNAIPDLSLRYDVEWGGSLRCGASIPDAAMRRKYLDALSTRKGIPLFPATPTLAILRK